jgi:type III pantothenate kinase
MNLALDLGNTLVKAALFEHDKLLKTARFSQVKELLDSSEFLPKATHIITSSVTQEHLLLAAKIGSKKHLLFDPQTPIPIANKYGTPQSLGPDRLAASIGAFTLFPLQNVLCIDAGTCIKYNFVNEKNEFLGGAISPGLQMRLKALNHFTDKLPLVDLNENFEELIGKDTEGSLLSGALLGAISEIEKTIEKYEARFSTIKVIFTGGDAPYLSGKLKNRFFTEPNLVMLGLNNILNYNIEK